MRQRAAVPALALATVVMVVVSWFSKDRCLVAGSWRQGRQFTDYCYTDLAPLWFGRGLNDGTGPWGDAPLEYPVVLVAQAWATAGVSRLLPGGGDVQAFLAVNAVVVALQAVGVLLLLRRAGVPDQRLLWWAAAPAVGFYALYNWDVLPVLLLVGAVVAHREDRQVLAGVLAGLGAATKLFPAVLVPVVVLGLLRQGRRRDAALHAAAAAGAWAAVNLPAYVAAPQAWRRFFELNSERSGHVDSLWNLVEVLTGAELGRDALNVLGPIALVVLSLVVVAVGLRTLPPDRTWQLVLPLLVVFLLTNKVFSPQYFLWVLPLMLLCGVRTPAVLAAVLADVAVFSVELPVLGGRDGVVEGLPYAALAVAVVLRAAALTWVAAEVLRPQPQEGSQWRSASPSGDSGAPVRTG